MFQALGGVAGCRKLSETFYRRVAKSSILKPLFPGKTMTCAIEEFAAYLVELLHAPGADSQRRWWVSLRESHARFKIGPRERAEWLRLMGETIDEVVPEASTRDALRQFFQISSAYITNAPDETPRTFELEPQWKVQLTLDNAIAAIRGSKTEEAIALSDQVEPARRAGLLSEMIGSGNRKLLDYALRHIDPSARFAGRTPLHIAAGKGVLPAVEALLKAGADPNVLSALGHTPLYDAANQAGTPEIVRALIQAGADVNLSNALHMAARRGNLAVAEVLLEHGAEINRRDKKGDTPLKRALNCRKPQVAALLAARGGTR